MLEDFEKQPAYNLSILPFCRCLKQLGNNHGSLVSILVPELLSIHPFFMGKEPDVDDPACIHERERERERERVRVRERESERVCVRERE